MLAILMKRSCLPAALSAMLAGLPVVTGCTDERQSYAFSHVAPSGWDSEDTLTMTADTLRRGGTYAVILCLRLTTTPPTYPYTDITLAVTGHYAAQHHRTVTTTDTLHLTLTSERGDMQGRGTSLFQFDVPFDTLRLVPGCAPTFTISHLMRRDPLPGISDVGLRLVAID